MNKHLSALYELWRAVSHKKNHGILLSVLNSTLTVLSSTALMANSAYIISFAALHPSVADVMVPVTMVRFFGISRAALRYSERLVSHNAVFGYLSRLRVWLYEGYTNMSGSALLSLSRTDALQTLTADIEALQDFFLRGLLPLLSSTLIGIVLYGILTLVMPNFAPVFLCLYALATLGMAWLAWILTKGHSKKHTEVLNDYKRLYTEFADGIFELKWNARSKDYANHLSNLANELEKHNESTTMSRILASNGQQLLIYFSVFTALVFGILAVEKGMHGIFLAVVTLVVFSYYEAAPAFLTLFQKSEASNFSAQRMTQVRKTPQRHFNLDASKIALNERPIETIQINHLTYQYPTAPHPVVIDQMVLNKGAKVAIVGPSGSGKSTMSAMISGLLEPHSGTVAFNDTIVDMKDTRVWQSAFATVHQSVYLFNKSLKDNLRLAKVDANEAELADVLVRSGLESWLNTDWYNSDPWIGENGMGISGGQRQRLALARALLKSAPILILDEAFAGLDKATEADILKSLMADSEQTLIWITHRLIAMESLDWIYVVDSGQIVASGTHESLMTTSALYRAMTLTQNNLI